MYNYEQKRMRVNFRRSGGFAGLRSELEFETDSLPLEEQQEFQEYVNNASFFNLPESLLPSRRGGAADYYQYRISIETPERKHSIVTTEFTTLPQLKPLIEYLTKKLEKQQE